MARKVTVSKFIWIFWSCESLFGCFLLSGDAVMARNPVSLSLYNFNWNTESISVDFSSVIVAVFERIAVEYTYRISSLFATQLTVEKSNSVDR